MTLDGLHHITAITADAQRNVDFYAGVLGLRLVKKTVNFDAPDVYHLYFGDERGAPGSILTFFEFPNAAPGRAGDGMPYRIEWRVRSEDALAFWLQRVAGARREGDEVRFEDPEGLEHALVVADGPALAAAAPDVPEAYALQGFHGVRAFSSNPEDSAALLRKLGFEGDAREWSLSGARWTYDAPPSEHGRQGAGSIHHVAWSAADDEELAAFGRRALEGGARPTPIIDRQYFHSVYFREPSGVLFELASRDIGFDTDEPLETLGTELRLPPQHEHLRPELERHLAPLANPRA
jgi:glyoxalase family protein